MTDGPPPRLSDQIVDVAYAAGGIALVKDSVAWFAGYPGAARPHALDDLVAERPAVDTGELVAACDQLLAALPADWRARPEAGRVARALADHRHQEH